jgi:hypothetical protein
MCSEASRSPLEQLPLEAKQAILSALTDLTTLKATALTCSSLYSAFKNAEELIITQVLLNEVGIDVLPEAIIAHASKTGAKPEAFTSEHLQTRNPLRKVRWKFSEALPLSNSAKYVNYFACDFAKSGLATKLDVSALDPSREELDRIKRAFYRFEIYSNIFPSMGPPEQRLPPIQNMAPATFFENFSPWENEQLACVHDYLFSIFAPSIFSHFAPSPPSSFVLTVLQSSMK